MKTYLILCYILALFFSSLCEAEEGAPQVAYAKFEWGGDIQTAHLEALKVLKKAGYRVPDGQEEMIFSCDGTLPKNSAACVLAAHLLCSVVKHEDKSFTNVTIITAGADMTQVSAERDKLHELMRNINGDREVPGTLIKGQHLSMTTGTQPPEGVSLVYAHDIRTTYGGTFENTVGTAHRILTEMDLKPDALDPSKLPGLQCGSKIKDNLGSVVVTTVNEPDHQVQVHFYTAVRYGVPKNASHDQLLKALYPAKEVARRYAEEMARIMGGDPGNSIKPVHSK